MDGKMADVAEDEERIGKWWAEKFHRGDYAQNMTHLSWTAST